MAVKFFSFIINFNMRRYCINMIHATISLHYVMGIPLQHRNLGKPGDASLPRIDSTYEPRAVLTGITTTCQLTQSIHCNRATWSNGNFVQHKYEEVVHFPPSSFLFLSSLFIIIIIIIIIIIADHSGRVV
jgi:hypothetical protein